MNATMHFQHVHYFATAALASNVMKTYIYLLNIYIQICQCLSVK